MKEEEILQGNKLIAEFLGIPKCDRCANCGSYKFGTAIYYTPEEMDYLFSWDWLMPVVEKIEELRVNYRPIIFTISGSGAYIALNQSNATGQQFDKCEIASTLNINYFINDPALYKTKIYGVYKAVLQFINWYNQQPPTP